MKGKTREEILGEKADEIREEIWENTRDMECKSRKLIKNRKIKDKIAELLAIIHIETNKTIQNQEEIKKVYKENIEEIEIFSIICECVTSLEIFHEEEKIINEILEKIN
jgi:hypothetical protein